MVAVPFKFKEVLVDEFFRAESDAVQRFNTTFVEDEEMGSYLRGSKIGFRYLVFVFAGFSSELERDCAIAC